MPAIYLHSDPSGITKPIEYKIGRDITVIDWMFDTFDSEEDLTAGLSCDFVLNGKVIFASDSDDRDESALAITLHDIDDFRIIRRPAVDPISLIVAIVAVAVSVVTYLNMPDIPGSSSDQANTSPNNMLNAASNSFRPYEAIPEVFGFGVSYPDFIQPSYYYYENHEKIQVGLFAITVGEVDISTVRVGETNINNIPNSSYTIYEPGEEVDTDYLTIHQPAAEVDGQELIPPDDERMVQTGSVTLSGDGTTTVLTIDEDWLEDIALSDSNGYVYTRGELDGVFEILSIEENASDSDYFDVTFESSYSGSYSGNLEVGRGSGDGTIGEGTDGELDTWIGWFILPGDSISEIWTNIIAPQGLRTSSGGKMSIDIQIQVQRMESDDIAINFTRTYNLTLEDKTLSPRYYTFYGNTNPTDLSVKKGSRWRARRVTGVKNAAAADLVQVERVESVTSYNNEQSIEWSWAFEGVTTMLIERRATLNSADQSSQKINVDYERKLPTYSSVVDARTEATYATRSFADAVAYTLIDRGGETESTVNLAELYEISDNLSDGYLGWFTYTFDDDNISKGERVEIICNAARVISYHDGQQWRFVREEAQNTRKALFNRRSLVGNNAVQSWRPQRSDDYDSVQVKYVDPDDNTEVYEERYFDLDTGEIVSGDVGDNVYEIALTGCQSQEQAANRADLEIRRLAYQRHSVSDVGYRDLLELDLLDRVGWVDMNDDDVFDGEIMGIDGDTYDTTERFIPEDGETYVVYITDEEGYPSNAVTCTARSDTEFGFIASGISGAYVAMGDQQVGSRYLISKESNIEIHDYFLKSRTPNADGTVEFELVAYSEDLFEGDSPYSN